jgi:poly-gamma-glutamate capsule biosynthesis protein CapA/YwtB (metallophosphatase superfamily)
MKIPAVGRPHIASFTSGRASSAAGVFGAVALVVAAAATVAVVASGLLVTPTGGAQHSLDVALGSPSIPADFGAPTASPSSTPQASVPPPVPTPAPLVPVVSFWSTRRSVSHAELAGLWAGKAAVKAKTGYKTVAVATQDADLLAKAFGVPRSTSVKVLSSAQVKAAVTASPTALGLIPAEDVSPDVLALAIDGVSLFGSGRIKDLAKWPLVVLSPTPTTFATAAEWTLAAGGDVNLSRQVYVKAVTLGAGPDYPWSAGYAVITGHANGGFENTPLVLARNIGPGGTLRGRFLDANLALVNLEGSAPDDHSNNRDSLVFTFDPALLVGLQHAGIDAVSLANNHIRNGGDLGVVQTCQHLDALGIAHAGAGSNITAARQPVWLKADGLRVAMLAYSAVGPQNWASDTNPGAAPLKLADVTTDIHAAKAAGADIVVVMPHWGEEYSNYLSATQKSDAAAFVAAGADLVLGSHSHWTGAIQSLDGPNGPAFVDYSMGDLLFNLNHNIQAQEGVIVTLTFSGTRLAQVELDPTVMIDGARVGLMDPAGDGQAVLDAIRMASRRTSS